MCDSNGNPEPEFTWNWRDVENTTVRISRGEEINGYSVTTVHGNATSRSTLRIEKVTTKSWRVYMCEVKNALGKDSTEITLTGKSEFWFLKFLITYSSSEFGVTL